MEKKKDFTQGNLSAYLISLAAPLIAGNILQEFYNTIDAFVIGRFAGTEEFAAIGIAGTAIATAFTQMISAFFCFLYLKKQQPEMLLRRGDCVCKLGKIRKSLKTGLITSLHQSSLYLGKSA